MKFVYAFSPPGAPELKLMKRRVAIAGPRRRMTAHSKFLPEFALPRCALKVYPEENPLAVAGSSKGRADHIIDD